MHLTQGTFSYLPPLSDEQIRAQVDYALEHGWPVAIEYTDDPHPRNVYWNMWETPMFEARDAAAVMLELERCRKANPGIYVRLSAFDRSKGRQTTALSFIVDRPAEEPGFGLERTDFADRQIKYTLRPYATNSPAGRRYSHGD
jgi:ribulose-bisphosphate carboxylase small chain